MHNGYELQLFNMSNWTTLRHYNYFIRKYDRPQIEEASSMTNVAVPDEYRMRFISVLYSMPGVQAEPKSMEVKTSGRVTS
jgi:hypothetical protein